MRLALLLVLGSPGLVWAGTTPPSQAPSYSPASIVNAASNVANSFAPNTFVSIYGDNLAYVTRAIQGSDISGTTLPTVLPGTSVRIWLRGMPMQVYYVSPKQINVLIPPNVIPGPNEISIQLDSTYGPTIPITVAAAAPALFQLDARIVIATRPTGEVLTAANPAAPGDWVILYATGLGATNPKAGYGEIIKVAAPLSDGSSFSMTLAGTRVDPSRISYVGATPGFAGLYQINCRLPDDTPADPEIRLTVSGATSPTGLILPVRPN